MRPPLPQSFLQDTGLFDITGGLLSNYSNFQSTGCTDETECYDVVKETLCHVGHAGEMFTSSAPYDPIFWPIHGLADRLPNKSDANSALTLTLALILTWVIDPFVTGTCNLKE